MAEFAHLKGNIGPWTCRTCGACCACSSFVGPGLDEIIPAPLHPYLDRPTRSVRVLPVKQPAGAPMAGHYMLYCPALEGTVGVSCGCGVYEERFKVCRDFKPGGEICLKVIRALLDRESLLDVRKAGLEMMNKIHLTPT
jgi:Fe-S-cluster containining protein